MGLPRCSHLLPRLFICLVCVHAATSVPAAGRQATPAFQDEVVAALRVDAARSASTATMNPTFQTDEWHLSSSSYAGDRALYKNLFRMATPKELESVLESAYSVVLLKVRIQLGEDVQSIRCQDVAGYVCAHSMRWACVERQPRAHPHRTIEMRTLHARARVCVRLRARKCTLQVVAHCA